MKKILLTAATHSLGLRVAKLLQDKFDIVSTTSDELPEFMRDKYISIPKGINPTYAHELLKLALDYNCDYILPLELSEIESLSESLLLFEEYGIKVLCPAKGVLEELEIVPNPPKEIPLSLIIDQQDIILDQEVVFSLNGLGVISDSREDFLLTIAR